MSEDGIQTSLRSRSALRFTVATMTTGAIIQGIGLILGQNTLILVIGTSIFFMGVGYYCGWTDGAR